MTIDRLGATKFGNHVIARHAAGRDHEAVNSLSAPDAIDMPAEHWPPQDRHEHLAGQSGGRHARLQDGQNHEHALDCSANHQSDGVNTTGSSNAKLAQSSLGPVRPAALTISSSSLVRVTPTIALSISGRSSTKASVAESRVAPPLVI